MNVLIIGTTDILGGAAKVSWEIKKALENEGHVVNLFVADKRSQEANVHIIPRSKWRKVIGFLLATEELITTDWILNTQEFKKADIVHCHNIHGRFFNLKTLAKMAETKPVVWTLHDEWAITPHCAYTLEGNTMKNGLYVCPSIDTNPRLLWDNTEALAKARIALYEKIKIYIVTPSLWLKERVEKTILKNQDVRNIPNGIDTKTFVQTNKKIAREKLNLPQDKKIVLFLATAGKANTWKGWTYTEEVLHQYQNQNDVLFLNVGNFVPEKQEANVEYRLHVQDPAELALYYSAADVLLFTSIAENFPLVILEAMSCGLPIVAFDVGGVKEVMTHNENGYLCRYRKTEDLCLGISEILKLPEQALFEISQRSSAKIKAHYDTTQMTKNYLALYQELLCHD
jgi:glycosyltransferase involved in cell wall biosynthesis